MDHMYACMLIYRPVISSIAFEMVLPAGELATCSSRYNDISTLAIVKPPALASIDD
jgi:hypothetical protein